MNAICQSDCACTVEAPPESKAIMRVDLKSDKQLPDRLSAPAIIYDTVPEQTDTNPDFDEDYRHWSPESQPIASADVLVQYLRKGWTLIDKALVEVCCCQSRRYVRLYHLTLVSDEQRISMPVLSNPIVLRLLAEHRVRVVATFGDCEDPPSTTEGRTQAVRVTI